MEVYFTVASGTYAEKVQRLLSRYRFPFQMTKITGREGCTYRFRVSDPADSALHLLTANGIPYQRL